MKSILVDAGIKEKNEVIELERTKVGKYTLKVNNKHIHSKYDPEKEAINFIKSKKNLMNEKVILVYGIGLGYHIEEILKIKSENSKVYVFEANDDLIEACRKYNKILNFDKFRLVTYKENFFIRLNECLALVNDIIVHKPSLETIKIYNNKLYEIINHYERERFLILKNKDILVQNKKCNLKINSKKIEEIFKDFNFEKWIVIAAGPSLDNDIKLLKSKKKEYKLIAVGTVVKTLLKNGITPDLIVIIDGMEIVKCQLQGISKLEVPLCFLQTASRWAVREYQGPRCIFTNDDDDDNRIETGKTVAVAAMSIAIKCGAKNIVMLGQDLAFVNGKSHMKDFESIYNGELKIANEINCPIVKGVNGEVLETTEGYLYFKSQIEKLISKNKHIKFINCSKGAFIIGAIHKNLIDL